VGTPVKVDSGSGMTMPAGVLDLLRRTRTAARAQAVNATLRLVLGMALACDRSVIS
jgi:hypothetical protein